MDVQPQAQSQSLSPFLSIWVKPRQTIRQIVDTDPAKNVILLAMLAGVIQALDRASARNLGDSMPLAAILATCFILGPVGGIISLYISGALFRWTGSWLGGQASSEEVRAAVAWSSVPTIVTLPLWLLELLVAGEDLFTSTTPRLDANPFIAIILLGFALIEIVLGIWALVLLLKSLGEVHRFSAWKALGAVVLGSLVILIPVLCLVGIFIGLSAF